MTEMAKELARQQLMADVYEDFEVRGELRISQSQCAMIGRLRPEDMHESKIKLKDPSKSVFVSHGIQPVVEDLSAKNIECFRFNFRVTPPATHMLSLFHAYIVFDEEKKAFVVKLNMKSITPQRQVRFMHLSNESVDHKRDLFCRLSKDNEETGRFEAALQDGDILQLGMEESVNRLRITIYMGEDGDGVEPYLHIREEPDARHIPIMMKLWEITEKMEAMQDSMNIMSAAIQDLSDQGVVRELGANADDIMDSLAGVTETPTDEAELPPPPPVVNPEVENEYLKIEK
eukprot:m.123355 g.123355  ORF g.123355 m.123355 type:complete len:288 (+) comp28982_c0_seq1:82-945(+)